MSQHLKILTFRDAYIRSCASVVGSHERRGPLGDRFDMWDMSDRFGAPSWERAESEMQSTALNIALMRAGVSPSSIDAAFASDLQNQCVASAYALLHFGIPYFGLYGACSTAAEGLLLCSAMLSGGMLESGAVVTSSHYCAAERQYRTPVEYGGQRTPTAQWTVTGAGAFILGRSGGVRISEGMVGGIVDAGIDDASNMGAAMAPAAADTLRRYLGAASAHGDVDMIFSGDLGVEGGSILCELMASCKMSISDRYADCGAIIYDLQGQDKHSGGSGCGCSAVVLASLIYPRLLCGELKSVILLGTGALMSPSSLLQKQTIPGIAHLVRLERTAL